MAPSEMSHGLVDAHSTSLCFALRFFGGKISRAAVDRRLWRQGSVEGTSSIFRHNLDHT